MITLTQRPPLILKVTNNTVHLVYGIGGVWVSKKGQLMLYIIEKLIY